MVFAVVERPFFAEVVAALEHFAVGVVTVVFVAGHQSVGLVVFDHDVVAVGETAQFFAVASVNGGQIAVAVVVVVVAIWQRSSESWFSDDLYVNCQ